MPIDLLAEGYGRNVLSSPHTWTVVQAAAAIGVVTLLKFYFGGARCRSERVMHGKVVMVTVRKICARMEPHLTLFREVPPA